MPYQSAEARLLLARVLTSLGEHHRAEAEARRAADAFAELGEAHAERMAREAAPKPGAASPGILTRREIEILALVGEGLSDKAISGCLTISEHTVHRHICPQAGLVPKDGLPKFQLREAHQPCQGAEDRTRYT
jgi:DNA-binding NarL/FixJ family response regulator